MFLAWTAGGTEGLEQKCDAFYSSKWTIITYDGLPKSYYRCEMRGKLENDQEEITTDTSKNTKSNEEVTMVYYYPSQTVKFIPNSLFDKFVNLEFLYVDYNNKFETMKREYLQNANKLKSLNIHENLVQKLDRKVFSEAKNLEHINFRHNQIESIHMEAFNGLANLQGVNLKGNKIKNLHPKTFSSITNLNILELTRGENCVKKRFTSASRKFPEIEGKISSSCIFELLPNEIKIKIQAANDKIGNLTIEAQANQEKFKEMTSKLEEMRAEISSQQEKLVKELADQQIKFDAKIASKKLQMEAKYIQMEAKLTAQMETKQTDQRLELLQEIVKHNIEQNLALVERINDQKDWNLKYSDEIEKTCENNLRLVQNRLTVLETKDD